MGIQDLFLDYLEKSDNSKLLQLGKDQFVKINGGPKITNGMIDCHGFSHGAATLQVLDYLEQHVEESEIIILQGMEMKKKKMYTQCGIISLTRFKNTVGR